MTDSAFASCAAGLIGGVLFASFWPTTTAFIVCIAVAGVALVLVGAVRPRLTGSRSVFLLTALFLVSASLGMLRFHMKDAREPKELLSNFVGQNVTLEGVIRQEVEMRENNQRIVLTATSLESESVTYPIEAKILVTTDLFPEYFYGDHVRVSGTLKKPENFMTDIGKVFDYKNYLGVESIFYTVSFARVELLGEDQGSFVTSKILALKHAFLDHIEAAIPAPESALLSGLLLGVKSSLGEKLRQAFVDTGLVHIIVLSGYNVTIIAEAVVKTLAFAGAMAGSYAGGVFIVLFVIMTGAGATIVRAGVMALLALLARIVGRGYVITRALMIAACLMILHNPYILAFDISFQLSFLATLGLIYATPVFDRLFKRLPKAFGFRDITSATFATQLTVLPFLLHKMGNLSVIAPLTNVLVLPLVPMTMFYGFMAGTLSFVWPVLGMPFGFIAFVLLKYEIFVVTLFAKLPFASFTISHFPAVLTVLCYTVIVWYVYRFHKKHEKDLAPA